MEWTHLDLAGVADGELRVRHVSTESLIYAVESCIRQGLLSILLRSLLNDRDFWLLFAK